MTKSILLVGVGGQGTILISKILTVGLTRMGYQVKMSEIHGMSQRGGSVSTQIKYGDDVYAPNIGLAEADMVISFEKSEAQNIVLLGALVKAMGLDGVDWKALVGAMVPPKAVEMNLAAYDAGYNME